MNAYSQDRHKKIVETEERGMPTEVARAFGVGLSSVKRYAKTAREGGRCASRATWAGARKETP